METRNWPRRKLLRAGALCVGGLLSGSALAACAGATPAPGQATEAPAATLEPSQAAQKVTIDFWWGWTDDVVREAALKIIAIYNESYPEVTVQTAQHEWGEKLLTAYAAGTQPDIHEHWLPAQFAARGLLRAIDDAVQASESLSFDSLLDISWDVGKWQGKNYIVPSWAFFAEAALCVNPAVYEQAGLRIPDDVPTTWDGMFDQAKEFTKLDDAGNIDVAWYVAEKIMRYWPTEFGIEPYNAEEHTWNFDDPAWEEVLANIARFYTHFGPDKISQFGESYPGSYVTPGNPLATDHLAMSLAGYWAPGQLDKSAPGKDFHYTWVPTAGTAAGKKVTHWGAHSVMFPNASDKFQYAWPIAEVLNTVEAQDILFDAVGWIGPLKAYWDVMDYKRYIGLDFYVEHAAREAEVNTVNPASPAVSFFMYDSVKELVDPVIYGEKDIKTALADFQMAITEQEQRALQG